ncbi:hypothetical protein FB451DRAFT_1453015 [Mycena latifolia]|nr:hypothetical protein FB451DRAFT_1453015 [Mycena latifolia]
MSQNTFGFHTTAEEVADVFASEIKGKNVLITGTSLNGIGFETARSIAKYANLVIITGYNSERLQLSEDAIKKEVPSANIRKLTLDLSSLAAVRVAAAEVNAYTEPLHLHSIFPCADQQRGSGHRQFQSVRGQSRESDGDGAYRALKLLASTTTTFTPRAVFVASIAHTFDNGVDFNTLGKPDPAKYDTIFKPYNETKSANVLTAIELSRRSRGKINSYSLHPGCKNSVDFLPHPWTDGLVKSSGYDQIRAHSQRDGPGLVKNNGRPTGI